MLILDIGSGIRPQRLIPNCVTLCVEPHDEYCRVLADSGAIVVQAEWAEVPRLFPERSVDAITILDVIEHLPKDEGRRLLEATLPIARHTVYVRTPYGFELQEPGPEGEDAWGFHGGEWQRHRSGWRPEDFRGWQITDKGSGFLAVWNRGVSG